jgi:predicted DNA-binding transcriptional regulator YafY
VVATPGPDPAAATERVLRLAYYIAQRPTFTMSDATNDIPDYGSAGRGRDGQIVADSKSGEALRKRFRRDLQSIEERFGIATRYDEHDHTYRVAAPFFSPSERRALLSAMALVDVAGIATDDGGLAQLGTAVDAAGRRVIVTVNRHLTTIRDAIARRHPIRFRYHNRDRLLDAWVAGLARNHWYVVGHEHNAGQRRVFRLDRIESVGDRPPITIDTTTTYAIPESLAPEHELHVDPNDWGRDPPALTTVAVHPDHVGRFRADIGGALVELPPANASRASGATSDVMSIDGWVGVEVLVRDYESFRDRVLRMGTNARVVAPDAMVSLVREWLYAMVEE